MKYRNYVHFFFTFFCAIGLAGCTQEPKTAHLEQEVVNKLKEDVPEVQWEVLKPSDFQQEILSNGILRSINRVDVRWEMVGTILRIAVKNGDRIKSGEVLAEADAKKLHMALQQASNSKKQAKLEMQDFMIGQGYKLDNMDNAPEEIKQLAEVKSGYAQAGIAYESAQIAFNEATLRAPISGVVANLNAKPYNKTGSDVFCTLLDNSSMEVIFSVIESEVRSLHRGDEVVFMLIGGNEEREGSVSEINPIVGDNGLVQVKGVVTHVPKDWFDGMKVNVKVRKSDGVKFVVPKKAVVMRDNRQVVFTLKDGRAYWNYVTPGQENSNSYVIEKGLAEGDSVIVDGNLNLAHLSVIKMKE